MAKNNLNTNIFKAACSDGVDGLKVILTSIEHWEQHGDSGNLLRLANAVGKKDSKLILRIAERCTVGLQLKQLVGSLIGWELKNIKGVSREKKQPEFDYCKRLAESGKSFRSKDVAKYLSIELFEDDYDLDGAMKRIIQNAKDADKSKDVIEELEKCRRWISQIDDY